MANEDETWTVGECLVLDRTHSFVMCDVCTSLMIRPIVLQCGHTFCDACVDRLKNGPSVGQACPICRKRMTAASVNVLLASLVSSLAARCINDGCPWKGKVGDHEYHLPQCQFRLTNCRYQHAGCSILVQRQKKSRHEMECRYRPGTCTQCQSDIPMADMDRHQRNSCHRRQVLCPYFAGQNDRHFIEICDSTQHMFSCVNRVRRCEVRGCDILGNHEEMSRHDLDHVSQHNQLLLRDHREMMVVLKTKPTGAMIRYQEEVWGAWSHTWSIGEEEMATVKASKLRGVPLTSPRFSGLVNGTQLTWRLLLYLNTGEVYLQWVEGEQDTLVFKLIFAIQDAERSNQMTVALRKHMMAGWKCHSLKDRHILPINIRVTITLIRYK